MAIKNCRECRREVSEDATSCPGCGAPEPATTRYTLAFREEYRLAERRWGCVSWAGGLAAGVVATGLAVGVISLRMWSCVEVPVICALVFGVVYVTFWLSATGEQKCRAAAQEWAERYRDE